MAAAHALEVHHLRKTFGTVVAVDGLDLDVRAGEYLLAVRGVDLTLTPLAPSQGQAAGSRRYRVKGTVTGLPAHELRVEGLLRVRGPRAARDWR